MMQHIFKQFVEQNGLVIPGQTTLLAVSGGRDSVVLAHLFSEAGYPFAIAHCNFHLRPDQCDSDQRFVEQMALGYGVPFHLAQFDTAAYASQHHLSVEEAAREQRYSFFRATAEACSYPRIATGHHADDSVETFFLNLLRGTGLSGLRGIRPLQGGIIRPLLPFTREQIDKYVAEHRLAYVEDLTNAADLYARNRIRHHLIPVLRELSPRFYDSMSLAMANLSCDEELLDHYSCELRSRLFEDCGSHLLVHTDGHAFVSPSEIYRLLKPYGFGFSHAQSLFSSPQPGARFLSASHSLTVCRDRWILAPIAQGSADEPLPDIGLLSPQILDRDALPTLKTPAGRALFDYYKLQFPLSLRHWREGDRFRPFGMKGSQLVSDYFSTHHFSPLQKRDALLLVDARDTILWIVGHRASSEASVTDDTRRVMLFTCPEQQ